MMFKLVNVEGENSIHEEKMEWSYRGCVSVNAMCFYV